MIQYFPSDYPAHDFYSGEQCRELDVHLSQALGVSTLELMRRAGQALFEAIVQRYPEASRLIICCGTGNNAGDGYVLARLANAAGWHVQLYQVEGRVLQGDAGRVQAELNRSAGNGVDAVTDANLAQVCAHLSDFRSAQSHTVVVDALLGTGSSGPPRPLTRALIRALNACSDPVVAVDIPSGLDAALTGGWQSADVVAADVTCSFLAPKLCLHTGSGVDYVGDLQYHALGATVAAFAQRPGIPGLAFDAATVPPRALSTYKHKQGKVVLVGGDHGMGGAIALAARASLATGAGLVQVITRGEHIAPLLAQTPELMVTDAANWPLCARLLADADVVALGPGLGRAAWGRHLYDLVMRVTGQELLAASAPSTAPTTAPTPLVLDADALFLLAAELHHLRARSSPRVAATNHLHRVITPHTGEAARLLQLTSADVERDRISAVRQLALATQAVTLLKGPGSLLAVAATNVADQVLGLCTQGNPAMATAGMGDVLTGMVAGFIAQQADPLTDLAAATATAMCWHSAAADAAAGPGLIASDVISALPGLLNP